MAYHGRLLSPVQSLMGSYSALITGSVSLSRVFELLDKPEAVMEDPSAEPVALLRSPVEFRNVSFRYDGREEVLHDVSFEIPACATTVLVGPSGSGKSTIADLMMRFYDPAAGTIFIDRHDIRHLRLRDLRAAVSLVEQQPFFFHSTIRQNLLFGCPDASASDLERAARQAEIHEFIDDLPGKYETVLGERGLLLSAGQRQRLAIARSMLRNPAILILDEPSAALDPHAEYALGKTLEKLSAHCTVLIATHRPALVGIADQVLVLKDGKIVESGVASGLSDKTSALSRHFRDVTLEEAVMP